MKILVTGGAGYIGSHTVLELLEAEHEVVVVDDLSNSSRESLLRVEEITGREVRLQVFDLREKEKLDELFEWECFDAVIHFAGWKSVGESVSKPLGYYGNNVGGTLTLLEAMQKHRVRKLVFSSSATVYGVPESVPITEEARVNPVNPYGQTKSMIEQILKDLSRAEDGWQISTLRYFNPVGAHESGKIGEDPGDIPNNLMPFVAQVAAGRLEKLSVFGGDYDTPDGTGVRDYIHVMDLAKGHLAALQNMPKENTLATYNLGTGKGHSVLEVVRAFEKASGKKIPYKIDPRRPGDVAECYADVIKAERELSWKAERSLEDACRDTWRWQENNPDGYES